jgi:flagellar protein FliL
MAKKPKTKTDEAPAEGDAKAAAPRFSKKMIMMAGGGAAGLLLLVGGGLWFFGVFSPKKIEEARPASVETAAQAQPGRRLPHFLDIPEMTVNLSAGGNAPAAGARPAYLRIRMALELTDASVAASIQPVMPRVQDTLQTFLRELRTSDLEGSAGVHRLREELGRRVNLVVQPARVEAVLFRELLVQ